MLPVEFEKHAIEIFPIYTFIVLFYKRARSFFRKISHFIRLFIFLDFCGFLNETHDRMNEKKSETATSDYGIATQ